MKVKCFNCKKPILRSAELFRCFDCKVALCEECCKDHFSNRHETKIVELTSELETYKKAEAGIVELFKTLRTILEQSRETGKESAFDRVFGLLENEGLVKAQDKPETGPPTETELRTPAWILPVEVDQNWRREQNPVLRYYKFLVSNVDWEEWPGGAAEILSAYETAKERYELLKRSRGPEEESRPTIQDGVVSFKLRKKEKTLSQEDLTFLQTQLELLEFFEWMSKVSYLESHGVTMQLSTCPVCGGFDPGDPNAAHPEVQELYIKHAGHKPNCKMSLQIRILNGMQNLPTLADKGD